MAKETFTLTNDLGLHARAAAKFVEVTNRFLSDIIVSRGTTSIDGKSIMGIISMSIQKGDTIEISINGVDEVDAMTTIEKLISEELHQL